MFSQHFEQLSSVTVDAVVGESLFLIELNILTQAGDQHNVVLMHFERFGIKAQSVGQDGLFLLFEGFLLLLDLANAIFFQLLNAIN